MRKIIVSEFLSMDGVIQAPGGPQEDTTNNFTHGGWIAPLGDEVLNAELMKVMTPPFDLLLGHFTYNIWAPYWPKQTNGIAEQFNSTAKYVVSSKPVELAWHNSHLITGDVVAEIKKLKAQDGNNLLLMGSANLVQTLLSAHLIDELHTFVYPVTLGSGKRLFDNGTQAHEWQITKSIISPNGIIIATYMPKGDLRIGEAGAA